MDDDQLIPDPVDPSRAPTIPRWVAEIAMTACVRFPGTADPAQAGDRHDDVFEAIQAIAAPHGAPCSPHRVVGPDGTTRTVALVDHHLIDLTARAIDPTADWPSIRRIVTAPDHADTTGA